jgi:hypothetical protein
MNNAPNSQSSSEQKKSISIWKAILIGQLIVNLPALIIVFGVSGVGIAFVFLMKAVLSSFSDSTFLIGALVSIIIGALIGWLWWSFSVPRWRKWALQNGAPEDKLQKWAVITGLVWPKGSFFEKTEFKVKE